MNQEQPELLHVKEEQEERGTRQEGQQLQHVEEADITTFTVVPVKSEEDEDKVQSSQLHQSQTEENREAENLASSSTQQTETGAHVEDCGGPGPSRNLDPGSYLQPAYVQQERRSSLDQEEPETSHIKKEEQKELWISQEGEQLQDMEEADTTMFTLVPMKSEEDEEEVQSSQLQNQTEERRESESVSSSSTEQIKREADGKDCGGLEPARNTYPVMTRVLTENLRLRTVR
ncbi:hypothetical protein LDENG_00273030 [Lucifuga dentata]|nr:hypothetical protein LDENG_00273030 [Lucifuga dentata]